MYEVGQILYLILPKKPQVVPVQIVEQLVRRTLDGEEILHNVKIPTKESLYKLEELSAEVYVSLDEVREKLHLNATNAIGEMITQATELASSNFETMEPPVEPIQIKKTSPKGKQNKPTPSMQVTLEDGTVANVTMPTLPEI